MRQNCHKIGFAWGSVTNIELNWLIYLTLSPGAWKWAPSSRLLNNHVVIMTDSRYPECCIFAFTKLTLCLVIRTLLTPVSISAVDSFKLSQPVLVFSHLFAPGFTRKENIWILRQCRRTICETCQSEYRCMHAKWSQIQ